MKAVDSLCLVDFKSYLIFLNDLMTFICNSKFLRYIWLFFYPHYGQAVIIIITIFKNHRVKGK